MTNKKQPKLSDYSQRLRQITRENQKRVSYLEEAPTSSIYAADPAVIHKTDRNGQEPVRLERINRKETRQKRFNQRFDLSGGAPYVLEDYDDVLDRCLDVLSSSPTGRLMLEEAITDGWCIGVSELQSGDYYLDMAGKRLLLDNNALSPCVLRRSDYFCHAVIVAVISALREIWQDKRNGDFERDYGPEAILMIGRVLAADNAVLCVLVGWELRSAGYPEIWRHLVGTQDGDMAMAFSNHLERNPASLFSGAALAASFRQWHTCEERVNICDHDMLGHLDDIMQVSEAQNPFGSGALNRIGVERLSCLPDKTAYLQGYGRSILHDPHYAGLNDSINQAHFFHIIYDLSVVMSGGVPFRSEGLARKIFPKGSSVLAES